MDMSPRGSGRFAVSLAALAVLAALVWQTMEPGKFQYLTWMLLGLFAFRIVMTRVRLRYSREVLPARADAASTGDRREVDGRELLESRE
jgi:hypothetical protein